MGCFWSHLVVLIEGWLEAPILITCMPWKRHCKVLRVNSWWDLVNRIIGWYSINSAVFSWIRWAFTWSQVNFTGFCTNHHWVNGVTFMQIKYWVSLFAFVIYWRSCVIKSRVRSSRSVIVSEVLFSFGYHWVSFFYFIVANQFSYSTTSPQSCDVVIILIELVLYSWNCESRNTSLSNILNYAVIHQRVFVN